jgi:hypothetical protein
VAEDQVFRSVSRDLVGDLSTTDGDVLGLVEIHDRHSLPATGPPSLSWPRVRKCRIRASRSRVRSGSESPDNARLELAAVGGVLVADRSPFDGDVVVSAAVWAVDPEDLSCVLDVALEVAARGVVSIGSARSGPSARCWSTMLNVSRWASM